ncbi:hypothetical protein Tco_0605225 [Tanacetum coccineum]
MACSLPHTDFEVEALVQRLINEDKGRQDVLLNLAFQFEDSCAVRDDLRKTYEKCNDISQESRALICTLLKESSEKDRELHLSMYGKAAQLQKQMDAKSACSGGVLRKIDADDSQRYPVQSIGGGLLDLRRPLGDGPSCPFPSHSMRPRLLYDTYIKGLHFLYFFHCSFEYFQIPITIPPCLAILLWLAILSSDLRCVTPSFIMALDSFHSTLSALEFDTFCNDYGIRSEFGLELPGLNDTIRDFPEGKLVSIVGSSSFPISIFLVPPYSTRFVTLWDTYFLVICYWAARISHFEISCRAHGRAPTIHLFRRFYLAINLPSGEKFFWVNTFVAPIAMQWFTRKEFPQDFAVDGIDSDMVLETLLNDNPIRIKRYPKEFLVLIGLSRLWYAPAARLVFYDEYGEDMRLQNFIKVTSPFDVVCSKEKLLENGRPIIERTADVVTPPLDEIDLAKESISKKGKGICESSSGIVTAGESASKVGDIGVVSGETPSQSLFDDPPPTAAPKVGEFAPIVSTAPPKWLSVQGKKFLVLKKPLSKKSQMVIRPPKSITGESVVGSSYEATYDLCSSEASSKLLVSKESSNT